MTLHDKDANIVAVLIDAVRQRPYELDRYFRLMRTRDTVPSADPEASVTRIDFDKLKQYLGEHLKQTFIVASDGTVLSVRPAVYARYTEDPPSPHGYRARCLEEELVISHLYHPPWLKNLCILRQLVEQDPVLTMRQKNILANGAGLAMRSRPASASGGSYSSEAQHGLRWQGLQLRATHGSTLSSDSLVLRIKCGQHTMFLAEMYASPRDRRRPITIQVFTDVPGTWGDPLDVA